MTLLTGTSLPHGPRTVCAALRLSGEAHNVHWSSFHQVLNRARWSPLAASRCLFQLLVDTLLPPEAIIEIAIDETLERRWGAQIHKRGHYRDSALSSRKRSVSSPGLRWIVMAVVAPVPWSPQPWALPFLVVLATTPAVSEQLGLRHHTVGERARQMIHLLASFLPERQIRVLGDTAYSCLELGVQASRCGVTLITPARLDSVLHAPPPEQRRHRRQTPGGGSPAALAFKRSSAINRRSGSAARLAGMGRGHAASSGAAAPPCGIALVIRLCPSVGCSPAIPRASILSKRGSCTDQALSPEAIITTSMHRWPPKTTFEESRAHLGIETQRQWSDLAIERTTPLLLGLYSLVALAGVHMAQRGALLIEQAAWYHKAHATFRDVLASLRRQMRAGGEQSHIPC